jgi:threonylcarbamoyladenosine tRNA methylthiotransferase MtaB
MYLCAMSPKTIAFHHFGCKVNFAESSTLSRQFIEKGYELVDFRNEADIYVISTCVVTAVAEKKCRAAIRQAHRLNPSARIAVIGCFPELKQEELSQMEGVNVILGHSAKFGLLEAIENFELNRHEHEYHGSVKEFIPSYSYGDRTRSFLKIQDGCDYYCAYCTIPLARGHSRSDTIENVVKNATAIINNDVKEIILTGVNIGDFGRQQNESLTGLLKSLDKIGGLPRVRISSIEPDLLSDEIIDFIAGSGKFMPHFHIPLQSGSERILKSMKRKYDLDMFTSRISKIRSLLPLACIATDIITGFPGETDKDFNDTVDFINNTDISYMHVFTYSKRENTLASGMTAVVQDKVKKERSAILHRLSEAKKKEFYLRNKGMKSRVLFESDNSGGWIHGFTENYIKAKSEFSPELVNRIVQVTLENLEEDMTYKV